MSKIRIAIVEDESLVALDMQRIVKKCGYEVAGIFSSGEKCLAALEGDSWNLVLMDIRLKGELDGIETATEIRSRYGIPVILITAYSDSETISRIRDIDPFGYLTKPVKETELQTSIEIALFRHEYTVKLAESEKRYRMLFEEAPTANVVTDKDFLIIDYNDRFRQLFGYNESRSEPKGPKISQYFLDQDRFGQILEKLKVSSSGFVEEVDMHDGENNVLRILAGISALHKEGRIEGLRLYLIDVTERKRLEGQLLQTQKIESIGRLAGGVAHDFNNLVTVIKGYHFQADINLKSGKSVENELEGIKNAADKAQDLTRQLLAFSRKQQLEPAVVDLNERVLNMEKMLRRLVPENVSIKLYLTSKKSNVFIDPGQFEMVLMNLTINASDAIERGRGLISITTSDVILESPLFSAFGTVPEGHYLKIDVEDNGSGIEPQLIGQIFEPFFTTKESGKGTGLGLATVHGIIKQSSGFLCVQSVTGKGTVFSIFLNPSETQQETTVAAIKSNESDSTGNETILIVEDDPSLMKLTGIILRGSGYQLFEATNPGEALLIVEENPAIDLVLADLIMPHMNGVELGKRMIKINSELKFIYMSGYPEEMRSDIEIDYETHFLLKPFEAEELLVSVRSSLDR